MSARYEFKVGPANRHSEYAQPVMHYRMDVRGKIIERSGVATCDGCDRKHEVHKP